jgi:hypothetical protein
MGVHLRDPSGTRPSPNPWSTGCSWKRWLLGPWPPSARPWCQTGCPVSCRPRKSGAPLHVWAVARMSEPITTYIRMNNGIPANYIIFINRWNEIKLILYRVGGYVRENAQQADVLVELQVNRELFNRPRTEDLSERYCMQWQRSRHKDCRWRWHETPDIGLQLFTRFKCKSKDVKLFKWWWCQLGS